MDSLCWFKSRQHSARRWKLIVVYVFISIVGIFFQIICAEEIRAVGLLKHYLTWTKLRMRSFGTRWTAANKKAQRESSEIPSKDRTYRWVNKSLKTNELWIYKLSSKYLVVDQKNRPSGVFLFFSFFFFLLISKKVKLATVVGGESKAPFSVSNTPRRRGKRYSFSWIAPLYPWYVPYIAEC